MRNSAATQLGQFTCHPSRAQCCLLLPEPWWSHRPCTLSDRGLSNPGGLWRPTRQ
jgi:hypothetical protein